MGIGRIRNQKIWVRIQKIIDPYHSLNVYKVFAKVIRDRISVRLGENQPVEQAGFRKDYSTIDHIHTIKQIVQKYNEYNKNIYLAFIDYFKAFDYLEHQSVWQSLKEQGIQNSYVNIIKKIYSESKACIRLKSIGDTFPINRGALNNLRFADDIILLKDDPLLLEFMIQTLAGRSREVGLELNSIKTKLLTNSIPVNIIINGQKLEYVKEYVYLGQIISFNYQMSKELDKRIATAWKKYWTMKEIMKIKELGIRIKEKTFDTCILPCITYGCETMR
ncbi:unnamed protein product [Euphydryas editha]|uniref:Reverse transcriptase domain-containing protein n=1 Tax=Euphydryas editha TaxID=104508 RepID=A0AAU9UC96_EUPED|nr:unnamed protein product [Euphydryas editha]